MKKALSEPPADGIPAHAAAAEPVRALPLRLEVSAAPRIDRQARAYAEYRFFAGLAPVGDVRSARIRLRHLDDRADAVVCSVVIVHDDGTVLRFRATGTHTYEAINKASERLQREMTVSH